MPQTGHILSGSSYGFPIQISGTTEGSANTIHASQSASTVMELPQLVAWNERSSNQTLTLLWGGSGSTFQITVPVPPLRGPKIIADLMPITGTGSGANVVKAFSSAATGVFVGGKNSRNSP